MGVIFHIFYIFIEATKFLTCCSPNGQQHWVPSSPVIVLWELNWNTAVLRQLLSEDTADTFFHSSVSVKVMIVQGTKNKYSQQQKQMTYNPCNQEKGTNSTILNTMLSLVGKGPLTYCFPGPQRKDPVGGPQESRRRSACGHGERINRYSVHILILMLIQQNRHVCVLFYVFYTRGVLNSTGIVMSAGRDSLTVNKERPN